MRLDKFLKSSRLIKRRTVAKEICDAGRISLNGRVAKAGSEVSVGDVLLVRYGQRTLEVRVVELQENPRKENAAQLYEVLTGSVEE
ncbi:MAG: hypothetical protein A2201_13590 [Alicyclobacillus sp. RIFOXYA1_FULL_53_8]|nr:MAG: hypothetical protein A2201_13590 [Alicyclobacillus sp. RIFOXYA1_FULL_53_8]